MTGRKRRLSPEEEKLWQRVAETATPLEKRHAPPISQLELKSALEAPEPRDPVPEFRIGQNAVRAETRIQPPAPPVRMDHKKFAKMKRGKFKPEGRIDLHGMTVDVAHTALTAFILNSHAQGKRLVLVITGKGKSTPDDGPIPRRMGILRQQLPHWLETPPLRQIILEFHPAHARHGGSGAFYVYLRR